MLVSKFFFSTLYFWTDRVLRPFSWRFLWQFTIFWIQFYFEKFYWSHEKALKSIKQTVNYAWTISEQCSTNWAIFFKLIFFKAGTVTNRSIWLVLSAVRIFVSLTTVTVTLAWVVFLWVFFRLRAWKKINKLFTGLGSVRIVKNCDLGHENAALGLRPRAAFSRPRSQFFTIRTSQPANNTHIYIYIYIFIIFSISYKPNRS